MSVEKIITDWKRKLYQTSYWLEGEDDYHIDKAVDFAEKNILTEQEASFNLSVFYGKDAQWTDIVNACRRYPMFAERQVVILKEAQLMKDIEKLEGYFEAPSNTTVFIVAYKEKKLDARKKFSKTVKENAVLVTTKKLQDRQLPEWTNELVQSKGLTITPKALALVVDHIGNDLSRIANEIDKLSLNMGKRTSITEDDIEKYIGISKDFNVFELQNALAVKDLSGCIRILQYFDANPKAGPVQLILPSLYSFFSKVYMIFGVNSSDEKTIASAIGVPPFFARDYIRAAKSYEFPGTERALMLLHQYNLKSIGIGSTNTDGGSLLKEMIVQMIY